MSLNFLGISRLILFLALCAFLSWPKIPLRMKVKEKIGRYGGLSGMPMVVTLHFAFPSLLSYFIFFFFHYFIFFFPLTFVSLNFHIFFILQCLLNFFLFPNFIVGTKSYIHVSVQIHFGSYLLIESIFGLQNLEGN